MEFKAFIEDTTSGDIAVHTKPLGKMNKKKLLCEKCGAEMNESPVGSVGRTGAADAEAHVTAELRAKFKKLVKELGGKTVARKLLAEMNSGL